MSGHDSHSGTAHEDLVLAKNRLVEAVLRPETIRRLVCFFRSSPITLENGRSDSYVFA
jgi:hypothetical protein